MNHAEIATCRQGLIATGGIVALSQNPGVAGEIKELTQ